MTPLYEGLVTALGIGLLIGLMRERRRSDPDSGPSAAGLRTHALAAVAAAVARQLDERVYLIFLAVSGALIVIGYRRTSQFDVGLTGEFALLVTIVLGALAMQMPATAASLGVLTAALLYLRSQLHHLGRELITERELRDGLLLAAAALIVLPMLPTTPVDPWRVIVPASLWKLVVLVMAAGVAGQVALRVVGARFGFPVAGFFAGFASSTAATIGYGQRVKVEPALLPYAASAALLANLATLLLLAAVLATGNVTLLRATTLPLAAGAVALVVVAATGLFGGGSASGDVPSTSLPRAFKLSQALLLAAFVAVLLVVSALLEEALGERGALGAAVIAAMVELQGAALAVGQLASGGRLEIDQARWGIVALMASSSTVKSVLAFGSGGRAYGLRVTAGLAAMVAAAVVVAVFV